MGKYVILMGVQGAGKGEQARYISSTFGIPHVSTGDLFRAMRTREDALAREIQAILAAGRLVDDETTCRVVEERLAQPDAAGGVILDGFPRTPAQADWLEAHLHAKGEKLTAVVYLEIDLYTAFKRAFGRVTMSTGQSYNYFYHRDDLDWQFEAAPSDDYPPRLKATHPTTGEAAKRRADDANAFAVLRRIDLFMEETRPLIEYYRAKGLLQTLDADQSIAAVNAAIRALLD